MQAFSRRGFQLRRASLETRLAYSGFLVLSLFGFATLIALSVGRTSASAAAIAGYYRGGDSEMSFGKTFWQLVETSHFHAFTIPVVVLILAHLLYATPASVRTRVVLTVVSFVGALLDITGPWAVRYVAAGMAYALMLGWLMLALGGLAIIAVSLAAMWGPERWWGAPARSIAARADSEEV